MEIEIPEGVEIQIGDMIKVVGEKGEVKRELSNPSIKLEKKGKKIVVESRTLKRKDLALEKTYRSHILNMMRGVTEGFIYKLKIFYAHFPMSVKVMGNRVEIDNFLGEKHPRFAKIVGETQVKVMGDVIEVRGINIEDVGQTAANLEQATRIRKRDLRVFQDGIYLFQKNEKVLK
ncbi:MAG: 50S ribosomal protein L6 [Candidatus Methanofastidiosia archaeon]